MSSTRKSNVIRKHNGKLGLHRGLKGTTVRASLNKISGSKTISSVDMIMRRDRNGTLYWKVDNTDWLEILRPDWQVVGHTGC
ncbi:hypothetical protein PC113_g14779 [Phytophthora cactorum]|uniref:Uncharacterized protein n=2 Tax=Phytophthora cactorum TaxID=29920 RepID=A0A8T0YUB5_9STRA|nr:hypothetical protein PC112_g16449 [Phytophthora cactorum]KAG2852726.1 hypothetical protein PC113_g14779 [Phytophthora cactorum]KAG3070776.1 hypothetical protein PC122_g15966 [Phytophthora cactorum]